MLKEIWFHVIINMILTDYYREMSLRMSESSKDLKRVAFLKQSFRKPESILMN